MKPEEIIGLINKYWRFDENQQPISSWHEKQDLIDLLSRQESIEPINIYDLNQVAKHFKHPKKIQTHR